MKLKVNGVEIEYDENDISDAVEILREDHAIKRLSSVETQNTQIIEWMGKQDQRHAARDAEMQAEKEKKNGTDPSGGTGGSSPSGDGDPQPSDPTGEVGGNGNGNPEPPPPLTEAEQNAKSTEKKRPKSRWWGDAVD